MNIPAPEENHRSNCCRLCSAAVHAVVILSLCVAFGCGNRLAAATAPSIVKCSTIPSKILHRSVGYCIDLPADYASSAPRRYPTLYFLHGLFGNDHRWIDRGGKAIFDKLIAEGKIGQMLVVMPDARNTFYVNAKSGKDPYENFFIQELIPYIDHHYRTISTRDERGISGVSMGGYGALHLAMSHPDLFGVVTAHCAVLLTDFPNPIPTTGRWGFYARILSHAFGSPLSQAYWEKNSPLTLAKHPQNFNGLKIYFDVGTHDRYDFERGAAILDKILDKENYPHVYALRPGGHGWSFLDKYMDFSLEYQWHWFKEAEEKSSTAASTPPSTSARAGAH